MFLLTCALLASAVLLRRVPLLALAVTLAGLAASSLGGGHRSTGERLAGRGRLRGGP
jgi:hypothetical protein